jgi:hypothetical protein
LSSPSFRRSARAAGEGPPVDNDDGTPPLPPVFDLDLGAGAWPPLRPHPRDDDAAAACADDDRRVLSMRSRCRAASAGVLGAGLGSRDDGRRSTTIGTNMTGSDSSGSTPSSSSSL